MIINNYFPLRHNYQVVSTNRFIVDSPRFWRKEFHPRFKDVLQVTDFQAVLSMVNNAQSFPLPTTAVTNISQKLFDFFSGFRFAYIPSKDPDSIKMFLADLYFILSDTMPQITISNYPLNKDDFNIVSNLGETGKSDTSKLGTQENNRTDNKHHTELNSQIIGRLEHQDQASAENIDEETNQNTKTYNDVFLSPQDQGAAPVTLNTKGNGVDGLMPTNAGDYTTSISRENMGDTTIGKTNTSAEQQSNTEFTEDSNNTRQFAETGGFMEMGQNQENTTKKDDLYRETLDYHKGARLQEFYNLYADKLWGSILGRLSKWILRVDIATGERNYLECTIYE